MTAIPCRLLAPALASMLVERLLERCRESAAAMVTTAPPHNRGPLDWS